MRFALSLIALGALAASLVQIAAAQEPFAGPLTFGPRNLGALPSKPAGLYPPVQPVNKPLPHLPPPSLPKPAGFGICSCQLSSFGLKELLHEIYVRRMFGGSLPFHGLNIQAKAPYSDSYVADNKPKSGSKDYSLKSSKSDNATESSAANQAKDKPTTSTLASAETSAKSDASDSKKKSSADKKKSHTEMHAPSTDGEAVESESESESGSGSGSGSNTNDGEQSTGAHSDEHEHDSGSETSKAKADFEAVSGDQSKS